MSKGTNIIVIIFLVLFFAFGSFIIYQRINSPKEITKDDALEKITNLNTDSPEIVSLYKKIDLGKSLIEKVYKEKSKDVANMGNDTKLLIASGNLSKESLIKGEPTKNQNGLVSGTYLINDSVIKGAYENLFEGPYTATTFIAHENLLGLNFKYNDSTKMYYCDNGCTSYVSNDQNSYHTKLTKAQKQGDNIFLYQAVVYVTFKTEEGKKVYYISTMDGKNLGTVKDDTEFKFTEEILKNASTYKISFKNKDSKNYLESFERVK